MKDKKIERIAILPLTIAILAGQCFTTEVHDPTPKHGETSVFAIGTCAVGVIFVQPPQGNWTETREEHEMTILEEALDGFENRSEGCLDFLAPEYYFKVPISYNETIVGVNDELWITEVMTYVGIEGTNWFDQMYNYLNDLRRRLESDWAVIVFLIDIEYKPNAKFGNDSTAYAYLGGPCVIYGCYGRESRLTHIHELAHTFYAGDEYDGEPSVTGYLYIEDNDGAECIMNSFAYVDFCTASKEQLGWRDSDGDGIHDIVDNPIYTTLDQFWPDTTANKILRYRGVSVVVPYETPNPDFRDITITKVANVQFRVDGGTWFNATPTDGSFDYTIEEFWFVTPALEPGQHTIEARGINTVGNMDEFYAKSTVRIIEGGPGTIPVANFTYSNETGNITVGQPIFFDASVSSSDSSIPSYTWDFGDDNMTLTLDPYISHAYDSPGKFTVMLNVTNSRGLWNITSTLISVGSTTDLNGDGAVNILDLAIVANAFGSYPEHPRWDPDADIDGNEEVNIIDLSMVAVDFGRSFG
jgi:PKD repeat protein